MLNHLKLINYCFYPVLTFGFWLGLNTVTHGSIVANSNTNTQVVDKSHQARQLLTEGIKLYEQGAYASAQDKWSESASLSAQQSDILGEAIALNNLASVAQHLGEWAKSATIINQSKNLLVNNPKLAEQPGYWSILAKVYNTQGNWQLNTGQIESALTSWEQAAQYYVRTNDEPGIIKAQVNQAKALQTLGLTVRSVNILNRVDQRLLKSDSKLKGTGLRHLGVGLRNLGRLERAAKVLKQSVDAAPATEEVNLAWLELGNTYRLQSDRAWTIGNTVQGQKYFEQAMQAYEIASQSDTLAVLARLNQLSLLVKADRHLEAEALLQKFDISPQLNSNRDSIYALLNYAHSLTCLRLPANSGCQSMTPQSGKDQSKNTNNLSAPKQKADRKKIINMIEQAIAKAQAIRDPIAEAQSLRQLAEVYELEGNYQAASQINQQALLLLEGKSAADVVYRLQWQLGRIWRKQNNIPAATAAYSQAIASLEEIRENILFIDPQAQFSFRDRVEPLYREYADLILTTSNNQPPNQANLYQAIKTIDALQLAELENFLGCDLSQLISLDQTSIDAAAAQIYPIVLRDRLVTIIEIPEQPLLYREVKVPRSQVEATLAELQKNLTQPGRTPEVLEQGQQIYQWLIAPLESVLSANSQVKTLVLIPDSLLRNVPFAILYDGQQYLIEKDYAFAVSPRLKLFAPSPSTAPLKVLTGGVAIPQTIEGINFPEIAQVQQELTQIAAEVETNSPLLNDAFTEANIAQELDQGSFTAIHWKTHGVFSSDPEQTFLVAFQESIKANTLQSLVQTASKNGQQPLELLVLSACETAKGDSRAILGLAGLTVRTGARTALSSYWRANDRATTLLMTNFYQQLQSGKTKAEALRQAQLYLLREQGYFAPHFWGTYVLVGNWL